jgi:cytochrome oxidase Cu insertion factor (SCO1/SenC/PrrC family)
MPRGNEIGEAAVTGGKAPDFTLAHLEGRTVSLKDYRGRKVVVVFGAKNSGDQAAEIAKTIHSRFAPDELPIISVLDLHGLPRMMRPVAKTMIGKAYKDAVRDVIVDLQKINHPVPADPSEVVIMLPDWDGAVTTSYGVGDVDKQAVAVVVDENGDIAGSFSGAGAGAQALTLLPR